MVIKSFLCFSDFCSLLSFKLLCELAFLVLRQLFFQRRFSNWQLTNSISSWFNFSHFDIVLCLHHSVSIHHQASDHLMITCSYSSLIIHSWLSTHGLQGLLLLLPKVFYFWIDRDWVRSRPTITYLCRGVFRTLSNI